MSATLDGESGEAVRCAAIYERRRRVYRVGLSRTVAGVWIGERVLALPAESALADIGRAVRVALEVSRRGTFVRGARLAHLTEAADGTPAAAPMENRGATAGFGEVRAGTVHVASGSTEDLLGGVIVEVLWAARAATRRGNR